MDLVSREETLSLEEAKDLELETSLMIMTAREIVRKGEAPTAALNISPEELRSIIRQVFRFPGLRPESPYSDTTAAEPAWDAPVLAEKTDLPTVPEHESEPITFTTSASLNSPLPSVTESKISAPTPITPTPTPPVTSTQKKQTQSKPDPVTPKKEDSKAAPVSPPKDEPKSKDEPKPKEGPKSKEGPKPKDESTKSTPLPVQKDDPKSNVQDSAASATKEPTKPEVQDNKKPFLSRLSEVSKGAGSPASTKDAAISKDDGNKPADNKEAKDAKSTADTKDAAGPPAPGQDPNATPNETPVGTPLLNQDTERSGTPSTGQSVTIHCSVQHQC